MPAASDDSLPLRCLPRFLFWNLSGAFIKWLSKRRRSVVTNGFTAARSRSRLTQKNLCKDLLEGKIFAIETAEGMENPVPFQQRNR